MLERKTQKLISKKTSLEVDAEKTICSALVHRMQDKISTDIANKCFGGVTKFIFRTL